MTEWDQFFRNKIRQILTEKKSVIDIGGGLRVIKEKNNRYDPKREWIRPLLEKIDYKILDPIPDYHPDIIGDIHSLPFADNSQEAIICIAVLEHVEDPIRAWQEIYRVLKPGGHAFIYVPFLYYYHAEKGYYGDFWRFTRDTVEHLSKSFSKTEIVPVRGAVETWIKLSPIGRFKILEPFWQFIDRITGKYKTNQVSGFNIFLIK
ncbi:hypothetical protein A3F19_01740 [Candidatus Nomurabacteria bacterium RIFCSPHIGHO2_12_FULL_37_29]|uniref:Methyltransferase type 11 domain-containing protein n=2 Tax=Parcubacteria group TaxID=1794811 RepID=A0A1G2UN88_9BACT|nr:MAG: hypothetical protein A3F19_01740 [Candidatus Nomurabacteria bacterium RIFCSPHIGHO2_12_FULL_37_29]OHB10874.1 MAG: hypothetical protein A3H60_01975 [Candidatus Zambryskibacteria bacterium RIFCSPLOWO2_02_FULL_44_12b]